MARLVFCVCSLLAQAAQSQHEVVDDSIMGAFRKPAVEMKFANESELEGSNDVVWTDLPSLNDDASICPFLYQRVLITGGTDGMGLASAQEFLRQGAGSVVIVGRTGHKGKVAKEQLEHLVKHDQSYCVKRSRHWHRENDCGKQKDRIHFLQVDVSKTNIDLDPSIDPNLGKSLLEVEVDKLVQSENEFSLQCRYPITQAVCAAAIVGLSYPTMDLNPAFKGGPFDAIHNNIYASLFCTQVAMKQYFHHAEHRTIFAPRLPDQDDTYHTAVFSSLNGKFAAPDGIAYAASKFAVRGLVKSVALEYANRLVDTAGDSFDTHQACTYGMSLSNTQRCLKIRTNAVLPGLVEDHFTWNQARWMDPNITQPQNWIVNLNMTLAEAIDEGKFLPGSGVALCYEDNKMCGENSAEACGAKLNDKKTGYNLYFAEDGLLCDDENECVCPPVANNTESIWAGGYVGGAFGGAVGRYRIVAARDIATQVAHIANPYLSAAINAADVEVSFGSEAMTM